MRRAGSLAGLALLALCSAATPAFSHGGDDHGAPEPARGAITGTTHAGSGETAIFSVVVKYPAVPAGGPIPVRVYVADVNSSAPIPDATVRLELKGDVTVDQEAKPTGAPGIYETSIAAPPNGAHADGIVSVQTKAAFDLVVLGKLSFGPMDPPPAAAEAHPEDIPLWQAAVGAATLAVLAGAAGFGIGRRSRRRTSPEGARPDEKRSPAGAGAMP
jgi:hypothetical protein